MKIVYIYNAKCENNEYLYAVTLDRKQFLYTNQSLNDILDTVNRLKEHGGWPRDRDIKSLAFTLSEEINPEFFI